VTEFAGREEGAGYDGAVVLGGVLATVFFPLIALIAALILQGSQPDPVKRGQLRTWAWVSAAWIAVQVIVGVIIIIAFVSFANGLHPGP
jgi:hypothetical protein